jgi:hypothetical protein
MIPKLLEKKYSEEVVYFSKEIDIRELGCRPSI